MKVVRFTVLAQRLAKQNYATLLKDAFGISNEHVQSLIRKNSDLEITCTLEQFALFVLYRMDYANIQNSMTDLNAVILDKEDTRYLTKVQTF